jgi:hypothetical protein
MSSSPATASVKRLRTEWSISWNTSMKCPEYLSMSSRLSFASWVLRAISTRWVMTLRM